MQLSRTEKNGISIVRIESKVLDASMARPFKTAISPLLTQNARLVLDLSKIEFIDSSGLGALVSCLRHAHALGGEIKIIGLTNSARTLFELVRMHRVFEILNSPDEAVASYQV